ncbi:noroxomaritidine synthase 3-like [Dioscorea cayenensis subsp. rotundata]|uniref:Noroxomaritidine synthase 3-like n=1 Tax=Dioscorea cayennensis subsp. rotundata TaxID=55577 RepID=A0AB40AX40_DIOCR|nr:noroxomaritidine synthase 3-like [Dioscorea cayenensis subsp. rotundata]
MLPGFLMQVHRIHDWCIELLTESPNFTFMFHGPWFSKMHLLFTCDPANINHIFNLNVSNYPKGENFKDIFDILGDGLITTDSESWKNQRKLARLSMAKSRFHSAVGSCTLEKMNNTLLPLLNKMAVDSSSPELKINLQDLIWKFTFDLTCVLITGVDPGYLVSNSSVSPFVKAIEEIEHVLVIRHTVPLVWWKLQRFFGVGSEKKMADAWKVIDSFVQQLISNQKPDQEQEKDASATANLLTLYMELIKDEEWMCFRSDKFLRDSLVTFLAAGQGTIALALSWFAINPRVEAKLEEEIKSKRTNDHDYKEMDELIYLHAALCEAMRLFPPVPLNHKSVLKTDVLPSGHTVCPGTEIIISTYALGRMKGIWGEDCMEFKPERWINYNEKGDHQLKFEASYKFGAFGCGPRICVGRGISFTVMKLVASALIYNFHFEVVHGHVVQPNVSVVLGMKNGLMVKVHKRSSNTG